MKNLLTLILAGAGLVGATWLAGCGDNATDPDPNPSNDHVKAGDINRIVPIALGNVWYGNFVQYNQYGTVVNSGQDTTLIERDTVISGEHWYQINVPLQTLYANRSDGFYLWPIWIKGSRPGLIAKYPAKTGDTFEVTRSEYLNEDGDVVDTVLKYWQVGAIDTTIKVVAGTFHCYEYLQVQRSVNGLVPDSLIQRPDRYYFARGVGFVSRDLFGLPVKNGSDLKLHWELTSADVSK